METSSRRVSDLNFFNGAVWSSNTIVFLSHLKYLIEPGAEKLKKQLPIKCYTTWTNINFFN